VVHSEGSGLTPILRAFRGGTDNLLTARQVAQRLNVCADTVYRLCERGELRHVRVSNAIRVAPADLEAFIARGRSQSASKRGSRPPVAQRREG